MPPPTDAHDIQKLNDAGVMVVSVETDDIPAALLKDLLPPHESQIRGTLALEPAEQGDESTGVGGWHVNAQDEVHLLASGTGCMQFVVGDSVDNVADRNPDIVSVNLTAGDVVVIRKAEHRFLATSPTSWILRYTGPEGSDLATRETGRIGPAWD